jgi:hypothetical protein
MGFLEERKLKKYRAFDLANGPATTETLLQRVQDALYQNFAGLQWGVVMECIKNGLPNDACVHGPYGYNEIIMHAACVNRTDIIQELISRKSGDFKKALTIAQQRGHAEAAKMLHDAINSTTPPQAAAAPMIVTEQNAAAQIEDLARRFPADFAAVAQKIESEQSLGANIAVPKKLSLKTEKKQEF